MMTNQQTPEIYGLHTVPNKGERPWCGIYTVRADAEHDAKVMRDVTGRHWSVVRLVVADTNDRVPEAWTNLLAYVLQDELHNRLTPRVIDIAYTAFMQAKRPYDEDGGASDWFNDTRPVVRELIAKLRKDLIKELAGAPQSVPSATVALSDDLRDGLVAISKAIADQDDRAAQAMLREILKAPQPSPTTQAAESVPAPEYVGNGMFKGETIEKAAEHWANWCDVRCMTGLSEFLRVVAARAPADSVLEDAGGANWQDISTAPKDGTRFVAVGNNYGLYSEAQHTCIAQWFRGCWMDVSEWNETSELKYLTHWMPLLPLPGSAARKKGGRDAG